MHPIHRVAAAYRDCHQRCS